VGANFIDEMTTYNVTNAKIGGVGELLFNSNLVTMLVENLSSIPNANTYPFNSLVDLGPWASSKFEIRSKYRRMFMIGKRLNNFFDLVVS